MVVVAVFAGPEFQVRRWSEEGIRHSGVFCDTLTHTH